MRHRVYERDKGVCRTCRKICRAVEWEADHIIPKADGGSNDLTNLQTLCKWCHRQKSARWSREAMDRALMKQLDIELRRYNLKFDNPKVEITKLSSRIGYGLKRTQMEWI